jgi:hypothetical protein
MALKTQPVVGAASTSRARRGAGEGYDEITRVARKASSHPRPTLVSCDPLSMGVPAEVLLAGEHRTATEVRMLLARDTEAT